MSITHILTQFKSDKNNCDHHKRKKILNILQSKNRGENLFVSNKKKILMNVKTISTLFTSLEIFSHCLIIKIKSHILKF